MGYLALTTCGFRDLTIYKAEVGLIGLQKSNEEICCTRWSMLYSKSVQTCFNY